MTEIIDSNYLRKSFQIIEHIDADQITTNDKLEINMFFDKLTEICDRYKEFEFRNVYTKYIFYYYAESIGRFLSTHAYKSGLELMNIFNEDNYPQLPMIKDGNKMLIKFSFNWEENLLLLPSIETDRAFLDEKLFDKEVFAVYETFMLNLLGTGVPINEKEINLYSYLYPKTFMDYINL